jgi:peptide/nickel transport system permease protein
LLVQYGRFVGGALTGDFGDSVWQRVPVWPLVLSRLPATALLAFVTVTLAVLVAVPVGTLSAVRPGSLLDRAVTLVSLTGVCVPSFWFALMLILVFAVNLRMFPTSGYGEWKHLALPVLALVVKSSGRIAQVVRTSMIEEMNRGYVSTARAKGLSERTVTYYHALKNAAIPIITLTSGELISLLDGTVVIEWIFAWPGLGLLAIDAISQRDLPLVQGAVVLYASMVVVMNLLVDLLYARIDPRVRFA